MPLCEKHFLFLQWDEKSWLSQADLREWDQIDSHTFSGAWYQHTSNQFMIGYYCLPCAPTHCRASLNAGATLLRTAEHSKQINSSRQFRLITARFSKPCEQSRVELFFFLNCALFFLHLNIRADWTINWCFAQLIKSENCKIKKSCDNWAALMCAKYI